MAKFILVDHSLRGLGSHHYEYALHVLRAARRAGLDPILATNEAFHATMPERWPVHAVFKYDTYNKYTYFASLDHLSPDGHWMLRPQAPWQWFVNRTERHERAMSFSADMAKLFGRVTLEPGDHVFVPTMSEIDFDGLTRFLVSDSRTRDVHWHLQFHYPIYAGREPDYQRQEWRVDRVRRVFIDGLQRVASHRMHFYTTTETLTQQHNRMRVAAFETLPYPANAIFQLPARRDENPRPLKVAYHGDARWEKGYQHLPEIVHKLWSNCVETGDVKFVLQSNFPFTLPAHGRDEPIVKAHADLAQLPHDMIQLPNTPLDTEAYAKQVLNTDVALMLYDPNRYPARCSGALVETLSAGIPVIVSAGTWLADQLNEVNHAYYVQLRKTMTVIKTIEGDKLFWHADESHLDSPLRKAAKKVVDYHKPDNRDLAVGACQVPEGSSRLMVSFCWPEELARRHHGASVLIEAEFFDAQRQPTGDWPTLVPEARPGEPGIALIPLPDDAALVRLSWCSPYEPQGIDPADMKWQFLGPGKDGNRYTPLGVVGLIAARPDQAAELLHDMVRNYAHYRQTAVEFAGDWIKYHNPDRIIRELVGAFESSVSRPRGMALAN